MHRVAHSSLRASATAAVAWLIVALPAAAQANMTPVNSLPNPYTTVEGWAKMPAGRVWGSTSAVAIDGDGQSIWVAERCGTNTCIGSPLDPVLKFDLNGNLVAHFGGGMIQAPHGIFIDRDKNVWVVDCSCTSGGGRGGAAAGAPPASSPPAAAPAGHQIYKFSPDGKLLMTLGKASGGRDPDYFTQPNAVLVAPNGDIFVVEGHGSRPTGTPPVPPPASLYKFSKDGKLIKRWGTWGKGDGPYEFDQPHTLAMDSKGRLFVGDRGNNRIKIFDQNGTLLDTWYQFSRPSGIFIDAQDNIYVADSESGSVDRARTDWKRGMRIGSAVTGTVKYFIPDPAVDPTTTSAAEGVAVDRKGNIYGAEVGPRALKKYVKP